MPHRYAAAVVLRRMAAVAGFVLALLGFVLLPVGSMSCASGGPVHVCYSGLAYAAGGPTVDAGDVLTADLGFTGILTDQLAVSGAARMLAIAVLAVLVLGVLAALLPGRVRPMMAVAVMATAATVLLVITELVALPQITDHARLITGLVGSTDRGVLSAEDVTGTGIGFWLVLALLVVLAGSGWRAVATARAAAAERALLDRMERG